MRESIVIIIVYSELLVDIKIVIDSCCVTKNTALLVSQYVIKDKRLSLLPQIMISMINVYHYRLI